MANAQDHGTVKQGKGTTKLQHAFNALRAAHDDVSEAKRMTAEQGIRISARTWSKAIDARTMCSPVPVIAR
jgi:hypothetical protein